MEESTEQQGMHQQTLISCPWSDFQTEIDKLNAAHDSKSLEMMSQLGKLHKLAVEEKEIPVKKDHNTTYEQRREKALKELARRKKRNLHNIKPVCL
jgi:hypothetical protein